MTISIEIMIESPNIGRRSRFFAVPAFYTLHFLKFADFDPAFSERSDGLFADVSVGGSANECLRSDRPGRGIAAILPESATMTVFLAWQIRAKGLGSLHRQ